MFRLAVIVIALAAIGGCRDEQVEQIKAIRDEVCACADIKCGEEALKRMPVLEGNPGHRARTLASEMTTCMSKLYLKPPDEDEPEPETTEDAARTDGGPQIDPDAKDR